MPSETPERDKTATRQVVIVDNHPLVRRGLTSLINTEPDLEVCAESSSRRAALEAISASRPDVVITGLTFVDADGLALVADIRSQYSALPILVLSMREGSRWAERALEAGANGYVGKHEIGETLLGAVRQVLNGNQYLGPWASKALGNT